MIERSADRISPQPTPMGSGDLVVLRSARRSRKAPLKIPEVFGDPGDRLVALAPQFHDALRELRRMRTRHQDSVRERASARLKLGVCQRGGSPFSSWDVIGLRGTSSDTVRITRQVVPTTWTFRLPVPLDAALAPGPIGAYGRGHWPTAVAVAATQLGIARRARRSRRLRPHQAATGHLEFADHRAGLPARTRRDRARLAGSTRRDGTDAR